MDNQVDNDWDDFPDDDDDDEALPAQDTPTHQDREKLEQQIRSAEGRYRQSEQKLAEFQGSIQNMQDRLSQLGTPVPDDDQDNREEPAVPEGWSNDEWEEFKSDQPVTADLYETQNRQVQSIREDFDDYRSKQEVMSYRENFRDTVIGAHPDFDALLDNERDDIQTFINDQNNPIVKQAYQRVYQEGTADEVVQLLDDYKSGRSGSQISGQVASSSSNKVSEALAVTGRSSKPNVSYQGRIDPDDFDQAWEDFPELDD